MWSSYSAVRSRQCSWCRNNVLRSAPSVECAPTIEAAPCIEVTLAPIATVLLACIVVRRYELVQAQLFVGLVVALIPRTVLVVAQLQLFFGRFLAPSRRFAPRTRRGVAAAGTRALGTLFGGRGGRRFFGFGFRGRMCLRCGLGSGTLFSRCIGLYMTSTARL